MGFQCHAGALGCALVALLSTLPGCGDGAPPAVGGPALNGCRSEDYVDLRAPQGDRTVGFGGGRGSGPFAYLPRCVVIAPGQSVTFEGGVSGTFNVHPLAPGALSDTGAALDAGTVPSPIPRLGDGAGSQATVQFPTAGEYPYHCEYHRPTMAGMIVVRPGP